MGYANASEELDARPLQEEPEFLIPKELDWNNLTRQAEAVQQISSPVELEESL